MASTNESIFNRDILESAIKLMGEARCSDIPCLYCALHIDDTCLQNTLKDHLRVLDDENNGGDSQ